MTNTLWHDLVIAIGIPLFLVLVGLLAMERWGDALPPWLRTVLRRRAWLWNGGVGLMILLSLLRWRLRR
ncbi:MAG: hypothetical protein ACK587_17260 [Cyanobacteriota bacterium]|jgi:hypothetical protein